VHRCNLYHEPRPDEDRPIQEALRELAGAWPTYGYRRLTALLQRAGWVVNEKRVRRVMHELDIVGKAPRRGLERPTATMRFPGFPTWLRAWR
jgi:putative transposase